MNQALVLLTICFTINGILLLVLFLKQRKDRDFSHTVFVLTVLSVMIWSVSNYLADASKNEEGALFWTRFSFIPALWMGYGLVLFSQLFPLRRSVKLILILYTPFIIILSWLSLTNTIVQSVTLSLGQGVTDVAIGGGYLVILLFYFLLIGHATLNLSKNFRASQNTKRQQVLLTLFGWTSFLCIAVITNALLPMLTGNANWSKFGPLGSILMVGSITYAIIKHNFLDIRIIIQRGLIYTALLSIIVSTYVTLIFVTEYLVTFTEESIIVSGLITTIIGIFGVPPLTQFFKRITNPFFFKNAYDYAHTVKELTETLNATLSREKIIEQSTQILTATVKPTYVRFALSKNDNTSGMMTLPIISNGKNIGKLIVGEKKSGDLYTKEDVSLLETFTSLAGVALEKANLYSQVEEYAKNLEQKVEERTKEVVAIQKDKEELMAEISHGLQTPLTIMKGEIFLLKKAKVPEENLKVFDASIDRVSVFINRLLSLSRIESSSKDTWTIFDISTLIETSCEIFKQTTAQNKITFSETVEKDIQFFGKKEELDELISNILSNAIKYMGDKEIKEITLVAARKNDLLEIRIKDNGLGIRQENIPKLFKKFSRIKDEGTKGITGTGLGLAICQKIAQNHKGSITVESVYGEGSTFIITLPLKLA